MRRIKFMMNTAVALGILVIGCGLAQAQATRTWVSGTGNDGNPCSRVAPCLTLAAAYNNTIVGGQINVIDAGGVGGLKIGHSITIDASESYAGTLAPAGDGIVVAAGAGDLVVLRGLTIFGVGTGINGISFSSGGRLQVENCVISGFTKRGIDFTPSGTSELVVKNTVIRENGGAGIQIQPGAGGSAKATIDHTRLEGNQNGLSVLDTSNVTIRDSVMAGNKANGVVLTPSAAGVPEVSVENCLAANNGDTGIKVNGDKATVRLSGSTVTANDTGLSIPAGGIILSFGNNNIAGNISTDGAPSNNVPKL